EGCALITDNGLEPESNGDAARRVARQTVVRLATDVSRVSQCFPEEAAPHALVELAGFRRRDDQRTQRAGGRDEHGLTAVEGLDRGLEAERAQSVADAI